MLALDIQWLMNTARLATDPTDPVPDWPPQPDRIYSALVASWGALGEPPAERAALEWLERLAPPKIQAISRETHDALQQGMPTASTRTIVDVYVPVNDPKPDKALPSSRIRQKRTFPTCVLPETPFHYRLAWTEEPSREVLSALRKLALHTSYVGHSTSLVRCHFGVTLESENPPEMSEHVLRSAPYAGRLSELTSLHRRHLAGDARARARPAWVRMPAEKSESRKSVFSTEWYVLAHRSGKRPDLLATAAVARRLRQALLSAWPGPAPSWLSGHQPDGSPSRDPHLAIVPLAFVGFEHATGQMMGLAIVLPDAIRKAWDDSRPDVWKARRDFEGTMSSLMTEDGGEHGMGGVSLKLGKLGIWTLEIDPQPEKWSLRPSRYTNAGHVFETVTPIALDRHLKSRGGAWREEAAELVAIACRNIGLPEPAHVECFKHSALQGAPSAWPAGGAPSTPDWARPDFLKQRKLVHARLRFSTAVDGPVILGAGRFHGLGLCLPKQAKPQPND